jgi:hypothetical protein
MTAGIADWNEQATRANPAWSEQDCSLWSGLLLLAQAYAPYRHFIQRMPGKSNSSTTA